jgi:NAD(P)-dependent dehydrogenase (short-subunit alcohol dehydrogenase family)
VAKVWLITGASKGFGRVWTQAALDRGDCVAATARDPRSLQDLVAAHGERVLALELDVTDKATIDRSVTAAHERFGRLDVVVNNAGYGQFGTIEEVSEGEARRQIETNLFGPLWVTKAAIPILREQRSDHILQVSSIGGVLAFPILGLYHASKWALEAFSQSLSEELEEFGVNVTTSSRGATRPTGRAHRRVAAPSSRSTTAFANVASSASDRSPQRPAIPRQRARRCSSWSMPTSRRCACSSAQAAWKWRGASTRIGSRPGSAGTTCRCGRRAARSAPERRASDL